MSEVIGAQGRAFYQACEEGNALEVTRMLGCYDEASLVNWRNAGLDNVRPVLREEDACGSPMNVARDSVSLWPMCL